ncbi:MAG: UDP-3-O-acyl-N-acetylglucosamine deacetylase [Candidatus Aminicenantes bacterium]
MRRQKTIHREVHISGKGIHSGKEVNLRLKPSSSGQIIFRRTDLQDLQLPVDWRKIEAKNNSSLVSKGCRIQTLEHILAVLYVLDIDSLDIDIDGEEIPITDGSASPFVQFLLPAGTLPLPLEKKSIKILKPFNVKEKGASVSFLPHPEFEVSYGIEFDHPAIGRQEFSLLVKPESFIKEIAPARTFGFLKDVPELRKQGLALGGSLDNTLVLDDERVVNGPLRFRDEFVRHKMLDFIGDLSLVGHPIQGRAEAYRGGHHLHLRAVHFLFDHPEFWAYV